MRYALAATVFFLANFACGNSQAALVYSLNIVAPDGPFESGEVINVALELVETDDGTGGNDARSLSGGSGLVGIAARLERISGDAELLNFSFNGGLAPFGANPVPNPTQTSGLWEFNVTALSGNPPGLSLNDTTVIVGTADLRIGSIDSFFQLGNLSTNPPPNNLGIGENLFSQRPGSISSFGSRTFNVTAVPEPSTLVTMALASVGLAAQRRRSKAKRDRRQAS